MCPLIIGALVPSVRSENPEEDFRNILEKRLSVDDLVYHGSLVVFHKNQLDRWADDMPLNDTALYHLINVGVRDMDAIDKPWDASMCSTTSSWSSLRIHGKNQLH